MSLLATVNEWADRLASFFSDEAQYKPLHRGTAGIIGFLYLKHGIPTETRLPLGISFKDALDNKTPFQSVSAKDGPDLAEAAIQALESAEHSEEPQYIFNINVWQLLASSFKAEIGMSLEDALADAIGDDGWRWESRYGQPYAYGLCMTTNAAQRVAAQARKYLRAVEDVPIPQMMQPCVEMPDRNQDIKPGTIVAYNHGWGVAPDGTLVSMSRTGMKLAIRGETVLLWDYQ